MASMTSGASSHVGRLIASVVCRSTHSLRSASAPSRMSLAAIPKSGRRSAQTLARRVIRVTSNAGIALQAALN
eukprot:321107-Rhodomonas_salina.1